MTRSFLFVPGNRPERFDKALHSGADNVIIDLEDSVASEDKDKARDTIYNWLSSDPDTEILIRINGSRTKWFEKDLDLCQEEGIKGIVLPKVERVSEINYLENKLGNEYKLIYPIIETAKGFRVVDEVISHTSVTALIFGTIDFKNDLNIHGDGLELAYFRSKLVLSSALANKLAPIDGVSINFNDFEKLEQVTRKAKSMGFGGKLCIHPNQVKTVNEVFLPTEEEKTWAKRILKAVSQNKQGAFSLDGEMIDTPVVQRAEKILSFFNKL